MVKCIHCKKEIDLSKKCYKWLDKENKFVIHDRCIEEYKKKQLIKPK